MASKHALVVAVLFLSLILAHGNCNIKLSPLEVRTRRIVLISGTSAATMQTAIRYVRIVIINPEPYVCQILATMVLLSHVVASSMDVQLAVQSRTLAPKIRNF
ncbi:hypothetical protein Tsubulata_001158 [Turnera subulata]|uniref:Pectinesterase inhibitor domain-containing protein n=1 Tax=Turnera subulata TaxID=218843 RepID=A0A9Q0JRD8_9ROSI|nr:hypothetical protein Tsubulata_001158 [Turnera subulata]